MERLNYESPFGLVPFCLLLILIALGVSAYLSGAIYEAAEIAGGALVLAGVPAGLAAIWRLAQRERATNTPLIVALLLFAGLCFLATQGASM